MKRRIGGMSDNLHAQIDGDSSSSLTIFRADVRRY